MPDIQAIMTEMLRNIAIMIPNILTAIFIFVVGYIISKLVAKGLEKALSKLQVDKLGDKLNEIEDYSFLSLCVKYWRQP